ncbi:MAG: hypothetical protein ICV62_12630 [Cyanobacteria bacterium Co-bin13]|nr:hypothetical protein [Cyanobacteria bacterium Co-bin13]
MSEQQCDSLFHGRTAVLATQHRKEQVIAPLLQELGVQVVVPTIDTDQFGTFTRDIKRPGNQLSAARLKAEAALQLTGADLALASEGSFGMHPAIPFLPYSRELVVLIDRAHDLEIVGEALSTETNFSHIQVTRLEEAHTFAQQVGFPAHGLVVMAAPAAAPADILKGITAAADLTAAVIQMLDQFGQAHLETDMRAMHNPTRMKVIAQATENLIQKIRSCCPHCGCPGLDAVEQETGLPCAWCGSPTHLTLATRYACKKCSFQQRVLFPHRQEKADPAQCNYCNP